MIAEDLTIEIPTSPTTETPITKVETTTASTEPPTSTEILLFYAICTSYCLALPGTTSCNEDVQEYRDFEVIWNVTEAGRTVVTECIGDGVTGNITLSYYKLLKAYKLWCEPIICKICISHI